MRPNNLFGAILLCTVFLSLTVKVSGQTRPNSEQKPADNKGGESLPAQPGNDNDEIKLLLKAQQKQLDQLRAALSEQAQVINELKQKLATGNASAAPVTTAATDSSKPPAAGGPSTPGQTPDAKSSERLERVEAQTKKTTDALTRQLGSIVFSGDLRLQQDSILDQLNATANASNPSILGNELSSRNRLRLRVRLSLKSQVSSQFDWGIRLATGELDDPISSNPVLTDFYDRKAFALDQAYIGWNPTAVPGLRIQGGKIETPWLHTEMTFDNDINPEGVSESYTHDWKKGWLRNLGLTAWELPFLERNSTFVRNANGTVNVQQSKDGGKDLTLFGGQARARFALSPVVGLTFAATDLYYGRTQLITPAQFFGANLSIPLTITIPANGTTPAQTVTTTVSIPRDFLVSGVNLGVTEASNNAVNRDGHLSSGFNLVDFIGRLDISKSNRFPVAVIYDFVINTQVHDVVTAGAGGTNLLLRNNENKGQWVEVQVGRTRERGDIFLSYTATRIDKDAVLTPFNYSDIAQQSDVFAQRAIFGYAVDPHVVLGFNAIFTKREHGLLGAFGNTPVGSLDMPTKRLQFETTFRF